MADPSRRSTRFSMRSKQLGQLLLENGDVQAEQVAAALKQQEQQGGLIGQVLQQMGACTGQAVAAALLKQVQVTDVKCEELIVGPEISELVAREVCESERLCPFERLGNLLCLVMANPLNRKAITAIEEKTRLKVKSFKSIWAPINDLIQRTYAAAGEAPVEAVDEAPAASDESNLPPLDINFGGEEPSPAGEQGILEIPPAVPVEEAPAPAPRRPRQPEAPSGPRIDGIDSLDESRAEVIEINKRGLSARAKRPDDVAPPKPKPEKKAKINVDLDALDLSSGEVVAGAGEAAEEGLEEIEHTPNAARKHYPELVVLNAIDDKYFYAEGPAPRGPRSDELLDLVESLPVAEVIAQSIGDYDVQKREKAAKAAPPAEKSVLKQSVASRPLELQPSPAGVLTAVLISENEFQRHVANLGEDPVGEWDWQFAASGPVAVQVYEEN